MERGEGGLVALEPEDEMSVEALYTESCFLRAMMDHFPGRIYFKDLQSRFIYGNTDFVHNFKLEDFAQIRGRTDFDFFSDFHARAAFEDEQEIIRTGKPKLNLQELETWPDGSVSWSSTSKFPLRDDQGRIIGTFGISQDITTEKEAQDALREGEARQRLIVEELAAVNQKLSIISNSEDYSIRFSPSRSEEVRNLMDSMNDMLDQIQTRDAQLLEHQEHLEEQVAQRSEQLLRVNTQLKMAKDAAEKASRSKSAFLANMSHELRTPLNAILLYSELLVDETSEQGMDDLVIDLMKIQGAGKHLMSLIEDILDLSKIEAGRMTIYLEDCYIPAMLSEIVSTITPLIAQNHNELVMEIDPSVRVIRSDQKMLRQTLYNLLNNSSKFTENGIVTFGLRPDLEDERYVNFSISDTGIGMSPEQVSRIFQEFIQAEDSTTRKYGGTGLGLTLSRKFVEILGGTIRVDSEPGKGSTFTVRLLRTSSPFSGDSML